MSAEQQPDRKPASSVQAEMGLKTRRAFLTGGIAAVAGVGAWRWIAARRADNGIPWPLRRSLEVNEQLTRDYFRPARLAREFPLSSAAMPKVNGTEGLEDDDFDPAKWSLEVEGLDGEDDSITLSLADIQSFPKVEFVTQLKCIEGWSVPVHWGGTRLADFMQKYPPAEDGPDSYVSLETPDGGYYVGLEMASALHRQTLLCYEMNGRPLEQQHGAPLRLVVPLKYGIKNLKRIGKIAFTTTRPRDFWAEQGYDYYSGF